MTLDLLRYGLDFTSLHSTTAGSGLNGALHGPPPLHTSHLQAARESSCLDLSNVSLPAGWQDVPVNGPFTMHNRPTSIGTGPLLSADCSAAAGTSLALDSTLVMHGRGDSLLLQSGMSSLQCLSFMHTQDWQTDSQPGMQLLTAPDSTLMPAPCTMMGSFQQQQHTTLLPHQQQQYIQPSQLLLLPEQHQQQPPGLQPPPLQAASGSARLFFAGVCPLASSEEVLTLFAQFGRVMELNLYRPYKHCKTTKGCGLVKFFEHSEAAAALHTLNSGFTWPGARSCMSVEWAAAEPPAQEMHQPPPQQQR